MLLVVSEYFLEGGQLTTIHGLDDKLRIMTEEKEAATLALRFSCLLDFFNVCIRVQRFLNLVSLNIMSDPDFPEYSSGEFVNNDLLKNFSLYYPSSANCVGTISMKSLRVTTLRYIKCGTTAVIKSSVFSFEFVVVLVGAKITIIDLSTLDSCRTLFYHVFIVSDVLGLKCISDLDIR